MNDTASDPKTRADTIDPRLNANCITLPNGECVGGPCMHNPEGPMRTVRRLCERSHAIAKEKGWLETERTSKQYMLLLASEVIEAFEDHRANKGVTEIYHEGPKPCGIPVEIADVVIRVCQLAGTEGLVEDLHRFHNFEEIDTSGTEGDLESFLADALRWIVNYEECMTRGDQEAAGDALGDVVDEAFAFSKLFGIDLWAAIEVKEAYNRTRPHRHGGKRC